MLGSDEERLFEGIAMDQIKAVLIATSTPLNAWLLTSALSALGPNIDKHHQSQWRLGLLHTLD